MPSRGNNGYIGGVEPRDSANVAKAVFNSREHGYAYASGDIGNDKDDFNREDLYYVRPSSKGGSGATATVALTNGVVTGFRVTAAGSGYTSDPTVTFTGGGGTGAEAFVTRTSNTITAVTPWYQLYDLTIIYGGEGYTSAPTITISAPQGAGGTTATVTSTTITGGVLTGITFGTTGTRYTAQPTITISTSGSIYPAQVVAKLRCGSGYTSAPTIGFSGGNGTNAAAVSYINADLGAVTITANGTGYTAAPTVFIPGMNRSATATATVSGGQVTGITISGCTSKFYEPPTITIGGWPDLPAVNNGDQKIVAAVAIYNNNSNFIAVLCQGAYTVDWGDGTSNNYATSTQANKQYTTTEYAAIANQSVFRDYKVVIVTITAQAGQTLTYVSLSQKHTQSGLGNTVNAFLDVKVAGQNISSLFIGSSVPCRLSLLEQFEFVGSNTVLTNWTSMFLQCRNLRKIVSLPPATVTNLFQCFQGCFNLRYIPDFVTSGLTTLQNAFTDCRALYRLPVITSSSITSFINAFQNCHSLRYANIRITSSATDISSVFANCYSLIKLPPMDLSNVTNVNSAFSNCYNILEIPDLDLRKATNVSSLFNGCRKIRYVGSLNTSAATNGSNMFNGCFGLQEIGEIQTAKMTNVAAIFSGCSSLKKAPTLDLTSATSIDNLFSSCNSLIEAPVIVNSGTTGVTSSYSIFNSCYSLPEVPFIELARTTDFSSGMNTMSGLETVPQYNFNRCTSLQFLYYNNTAISVPSKISALSATSTSYLLNGASSIKYIEGIDLGAVTACDNFYVSCDSLISAPVLNLTSVATAQSSFATNTMIRSGYTTGMRYGHSYQNSNLAAAELNTIYTNLGTAVGAQTITVTGNWGTTTDDTTIATNKGWTVSG